MSLIVECSRAFQEKVVELKLSPPICMGLFEYDPEYDEVNRPVYGQKISRRFIGFCSEEEMRSHLLFHEKMFHEAQR